METSPQISGEENDENGKQRDEPTKDEKRDIACDVTVILWG